jgi:hypothetical protein
MAMQNLLGDLALDDSVVLLRKIVKLLEASGNVDSANRQRIYIDGILNGLVLSTVGVVSTVTTVTSVTDLAGIAGWDRRMFVDPARTAFNTGIRSKLAFT